MPSTYTFYELANLFFGGCDNLLYAHSVFVIISVFTTALVSIVCYGNFRMLSMKLFVHKTFEFLFVGLGHTIDLIITNDCNTFRTMIIMCYIGYEGLMILNNAIILGLPVPDKLKKLMQFLFRTGG